MPTMVRFSRSLRGVAVLLATLALVGRLVSGSVVLDPGSLNEIAALLAASVQCQPDGGAQDGGAQDAGTKDGHHGKAPRPGPDSAIAALASLGPDALPILTPEVRVPAPGGGIVVCAAPLPTARGPPACLPGASLPRGPPVLT